MLSRCRDIFSARHPSSDGSACTVVMSLMDAMAAVTSVNDAITIREILARGLRGDVTRMEKKHR